MTDINTDRYADPVAASLELHKQAEMRLRISNLKADPATMAELASLFAHSYVAGTNWDSDEEAQEKARAYYAQYTDRAGWDLREEAVDALAHQALYGPNGSDAARAASHATRWTSED